MPAQLDQQPTASPAPGPRKPRSSGKVLGAVLAVAFLLAGGGAVAYTVHQHQVSAAQARDEAKARAAAAKRRAAAAAAKAAELKQERNTYQSCRNELMPLYNALSSINSRLNVGMTQADLGSAVGEASIAYDRIHIHKLGDGACLASGAKLEDAFNQYTTTSNTWNDCITNLYCDTDSITPGMQRKWSLATQDLSRARHLLQELNPDSSQFKRNTSSSSGA
jgi:hypothetical protein